MADYKPGDLLVGIVDFFAIILPGAVLTFVGLKFEKKIFDGSILPALPDGPSRWIAFTLAAYLVGNIVYLLGASILDPIYSSTYREFKSQQTDDLLYKAAKDIRLKLLYRDDIENVFKCSRALVRLKNSCAAAEIDRLEASSKFFRSLVVVLFFNLFILGVKPSPWPLMLIMAVISFSYLQYSQIKKEKLQEREYLRKSVFWQKVVERVENIQKRRWLTRSLFGTAALTLMIFTFWRKAEWVLLGICLLMLYLSFWCYASQRWKMTQAAYLYFVLLSSLPDDKDKKAEGMSSTSAGELSPQ